MRKEADNFMLFGGYDAASLFDQKRNKEAKTTEIRNLTFWDTLIQRADHARMNFLGTIYNVLTSEKPKTWYNTFFEKFEDGKSTFENEIVVKHEKYISGTNFSSEYRKNKKWYHMKMGDNTNEYKNENEKYRK